MAQVVAVLGQGLVDPTGAILPADDLGVVRGDGVFETIATHDGELVGLEPHLARLWRSAELLDFALPDPAAVRALIEEAHDAFGHRVEGALRIVATRGPETGGPATVYITVNPIGADVIATRRDGLRLTALSTGLPVDARSRSPWLLGGAKSLSYAVTMAARRYAIGNGFDDALWVSEDGWALEGLTSTLVWLRGAELCTVPVDTGILAGTTADRLLDRATDVGLTTARYRIRPGELADADGVWMASSTRGLAPVVSLDDTPLRRSEHGPRLLALLGYPMP